MDVIRTPDERFAGLPSWPYEPRYVSVPDGEGGALRMHHVDQGPRGAAPILCLHGQPTWSFLYRKMIPRFTAAGQRVVAPDLVGFGRSDKPMRATDYSYARHVAWLRAFVESIDLHGITLMRAMCPKLAPAEAAAYDAPFPDERYLAGARRFPMLVPILPDDPAIPDNRRAWEALRRFERPFLTAFTDGDPVTRGQDLRFREEIPGAQGQPHTTITGAGHFVQEEAGEELARIALDFIARSPAA
jgi:haloalkane dehalogenase